MVFLSEDTDDNTDKAAAAALSRKTDNDDESQISLDRVSTPNSTSDKVQFITFLV